MWTERLTRDYLEEHKKRKLKKEEEMEAKYQGEVREKEGGYMEDSKRWTIDGIESAQHKQITQQMGLIVLKMNECWVY